MTRERLKLIRLYLAILLAMSACAAADLSKATKYADKAMAVVDIAANKGAVAYQKAVAVGVELCRAELGEVSTPEQREACLAKRGFAPDQIEKIEDAYKSLAIAYDAIAEALELIREAAPEIEKAKSAVKAVSQ